MAEVASASIRLVGAPRMPNGRKMSGLGIDFCDTSTPESPSHHWEEDLPHHPSFTYNGTVPPRTSRWSESTQQSRATKASSSRGASSRVSQSNSVASSLSTQQAVPVTQEEAYVSNIVARKRPSEAEVQAFIDGNYNQRSARGSDVSQDSYGPITPQDEHEDRQIRLASFASFGETPRKAPVPPQLSSEVSVDMDAKLQRRPSLTQSMMRTLGGRKKETRPPPPLTLVPPVPKVPLMPPSFELAPIIHRLERPVAKRSATRSSDSGTTRLSPPLASISPRPRTSSGRRSSGTAFSTLFRSVRKTMSRKSSKASPLIDASGKMSLTRSPVPSINGNAPSFVSIQVETSIEVQSTPSSPGTDRRAALQVISPASQAGKAYSRPSTAPEGRRGDFSSKHHIPPYIQSVASSPASNASPVMRHEATPGSFDIQYRDPWKKLAGFEPASSYAQAQMIPPSPPSWVVSHQLAAKQAAAHGSEAQQDLLQVPASLYAHSSVDTGCSLASGSPTSVPSWTPMVALPSPDVSILHTPSRSFLELEASPSSAKYTFGTPSTSSKQGQAKAGTRDKSPFLLTPGQISMRDPWARSDDKTEDTRGTKAAGGFKLSRDDSDASLYSTSPAESSKSPQFNASPRARRPSRKAVPKIDEGEMLRSASTEKNDRAKEIYAGCRPFHRPSVDEQLSDMVSMKMPFVARSSLADITEGRPSDNYFSEIPRSTSLAGRNASWSSDRGMVPPPHLPRPSFPTFETTYTIRRPSYASEMSNQSFPSKPTRFEFRRPTLIPPEGIRISFDAGTVNV